MLAFRDRRLGDQAGASSLIVWQSHKRNEGRDDYLGQNVDDNLSVQLAGRLLGPSRDLQFGLTTVLNSSDRRQLLLLLLALYDIAPIVCAQMRRVWYSIIPIA